MGRTREQAEPSGAQRTQRLEGDSPGLRCERREVTPRSWSQEEARGGRAPVRRKLVLGMSTNRQATTSARGRFLGDTNDRSAGKAHPPASQPPTPNPAGRACGEAAGPKQAALRVLVPPHRAEGLGRALS